MTPTSIIATAIAKDFRTLGAPRAQSGRRVQPATRTAARWERGIASKKDCRGRNLPELSAAGLMVAGLMVAPSAPFGWVE